MIVRLARFSGRLWRRMGLPVALTDDQCVPLCLATREQIADELHRRDDGVATLMVHSHRGRHQLAYRGNGATLLGLTVLAKRSIVKAITQSSEGKN